MSDPEALKEFSSKTKQITKVKTDRAVKRGDKETRATKAGSYRQIGLLVQCRRGYLTAISQSMLLFCRGYFFLLFCL